MPAFTSLPHVKARCANASKVLCFSFYSNKKTKKTKKREKYSPPLPHVKARSANALLHIFPVKSSPLLILLNQKDIREKETKRQIDQKTKIDKKQKGKNTRKLKTKIPSSDEEIQWYTFSSSKVLRFSFCSNKKTKEKKETKRKKNTKKTERQKNRNTKWLNNWIPSSDEEIQC